MIDRDYFQEFKILFVEDEELARNQLTKILQKLFKNVSVASNGKEGLEIFEKEDFDLIISDINMPIMNGLEMVENIRKVNEDIPVIFTTARTESENILKAVDLNVNHYIIKPIDTDNLLIKLSDICEKQIVKKELKEKKEEFQKYLDAVDKVAIIYKMNEDGKIIYANNKLLETSQYTQEEILQINFNNLIHPDIPKDAVEKSWNEIRSGDIWSGNTKFIGKDEEAFYLKNTVFKVIQKNEIEYITIGFLTTNENVEKREFKRKVIKSIQEFNKKEHLHKKLILEQNDRIKQLEAHLPRLAEMVEEEKAKALAKQRQLDHYELQMHNVDEKYYSSLTNITKEQENNRQVINTLKYEKTLLLKKTKEYIDEIKATKKELKLLMETNEQKNKRIADLNDVINSLESKIKELQEEEIPESEIN